jgi:hypothetical protein
MRVQRCIDAGLVRRAGKEGRKVILELTDRGQSVAVELGYAPKVY